MLVTRLTTKDNPFDPFDDYDRWKAFDEEKGYYTENLIARIIITSNEASEEELEMDYARAINDIMKYCDYGIYEVKERDLAL